VVEGTNKSMTKNVLKLPQLAWQGTRDLKIALPDRWDVNVCNMQGFNRRALTDAEIGSVIQKPIGMEPLRQIARGRKQVVIIFDDITRATRVSRIVPFVLQELAEAGIADENIRFISATGTHAPLNRFDFVNKLGEEVVRRFPVYNHNAFANYLDIGTTAHGIHLRVNAEVMSCDLKIGIGSVVPHSFAGFGGGAKIIIPGICYVETCSGLHQMGMKYNKEHPESSVSLGTFEDNVIRQDMLETARRVGLDMKIDAVINSYGETAALFAGTPAEEYADALTDARGHYKTVLKTGNDIVILNNFSKVAEIECAMAPANPSLKDEGGYIVLIGNAPQGHVTHYLASPWGKNSVSNTQKKRNLKANVRRLIIYNEYPDQTMPGYFAQPEKITLLSKWEDVVALLEKEYPGKAAVAVYPNADIQYW
jgi:lactate racemase